MKGTNKRFCVVLPIGIFLAYIGVTMLCGLFTANPVQAQFVSNVFWVLLGFGFWLYERYTDRKECRVRELFRPRAWSVFVLVVICIVFGLLIPIVGFGLQTHIYDTGAEVYQTSIQQDAGLFLLMSVFLAPVVEEMLFRWFMYKPWKKAFGTVVSMLLTSTIFAIIHGTLQHLPVAFFVGFFGCVLIEVTGQLRYAVLNHFIYNLLAVAVVPALLPADGSWLYSYPAMLVLYMVCIGSVIWMYRYRKAIKTYVTSDHLIDKWNRKWDETVSK